MVFTGLEKLQLVNMPNLIVMCMVAEIKSKYWFCFEVKKFIEETSSHKL